jgi:hypothetical protein
MPKTPKKLRLTACNPISPKMDRFDLLGIYSKSRIKARQRFFGAAEHENYIAVDF